MKALIVVDVDDIQRWTHAKVYLAHKDEEGDGWWADWEYKTYPLRPMPQKKEVEVNEIEDIMHTEYSIEDIYTNKYVATIRLATDKLISLGWNGCLDEILGGNEND